MTEREKAPLVLYLEKLAQRQDRGALAALRRGLGKPPGTVVATYRHVTPFVPEAAARGGRDWPWYLVASLFALHPDSGARGDMGWTYRRLGDHPSAEARFGALLDCAVEELPYHLRQAVSLAKSAKRRTPVDYDLLLRHAQHWDHPDRWVQRRWARSYWGPDAKQAPDEDQGGDA